jgi:thiopurine S-methyltransferase
MELASRPTTPAPTTRPVTSQTEARVQPDFWHERWRTGQIGFHQPGPHPCLERWWPTLQVAPGARVYVPLCGKSIDMVWLAVRGYRVVGSELSPLAVQEFFGEQHGGSAAIDQHGPFRRHSAGAFEILEGDALLLTPELLGPVHAAYDRAALVALPPPMREDYAASFAALMPTQSRTLLVAFEYAQPMRDGPPFSVEPDEIQRLYREQFRIRELERIDIIAESPKFAAAGLEALHEVVYSLTRK